MTALLKQISSLAKFILLKIMESPKLKGTRLLAKIDSLLRVNLAGKKERVNLADKKKREKENLNL